MSTGLEGSLGKLEVTNDIGEALDKQLQQAENQAQQLLGGTTALKVAAKKVGALGEHISQDLEEGKLQFSTELEAATYTKEWIRRACEVLNNLAEKSKSEELVAHGKAKGLRDSMEMVGRHCKAAKARAEQLVAAAEEAQAKAAEGAKGDGAEVPEDAARGGARAPGERPGPSTLDERRAEAAQAKAAQSAEGDSAEAKAAPPMEEASQAKLPVEPSAPEPKQPPAPIPKPRAKKKVARKKVARKKAKRKVTKTNRKPPLTQAAAEG